MFFLLLCILLFGCATTKEIENLAVGKAISLQQDVLNDPLFEKILTELDVAGEIDWSHGRTSKIDAQLPKYNSKIAWLLSRYKNDGGFSKDSVLLWRKYNPWSSTTAVTGTCARKTKLNKWKLKRDEFSIVNTLIHERVHSFCLIHAEESQTRKDNQCDASYIAGDLAEILILYRKGVKERVMEGPICPALLKAVAKYKLLIIKTD